MLRERHDSFSYVKDINLLQQYCFLLLVNFLLFQILSILEIFFIHRGPFLLVAQGTENLGDGSGHRM